MGRKRHARRVGAVLVAVITIGLVGTGIAGGSSSKARGSAAVTYIVVGPPKATPARLAKTAAVLQQRLRALGAKHAQVHVKQHRLVATGAGIRALGARATAPGRLTLRPVLAILPPAVPNTPGGVAGTSTPDGEVLPGRPEINAANAVQYQVGTARLTGAGVRSARAELQPGIGWTVDLSLNRRGNAAFDRMAKDQYRKSPPQNGVAIVIDGVVQSAPEFQTDSFRGDVSIAGSFTGSQAKALATTLRDGPLPLHLRPVVPDR